MARKRPPRTRSIQQRDARELALTAPTDPYRGQLLDPFTAAAPPVSEPAGAAAGRIDLPGQPTARPRPTTTPPFGSARSRVEPVRVTPVDPGTPGWATIAGVFGIVLGLTQGVFGLLLVSIVNLENSAGAPDRSFYRGTDSGYVILGLIDFGLAVLCGIGGILLMGGRVTGRVMLTAGGWLTLVLSMYWLLDSSIAWIVPVLVAVAAVVMLFGAYTPRVTRWLGVLAAPQPE